jgi:MFS family permease
MREALRSRDFRLLWLGQSLSEIGDNLVLVAIALFVTRLTGHPGDVGIVLAAYALPLVLFVVVGGVVADRLPRHRVMMVADLVRTALHLVLALLIATGTVRIWHMVVIGVLFSTAEAFFQPAYSGLVPQTVPEADIQAAQALGGVSRELAAALGPALATGLVLTAGSAAAFGLDAFTFAVSAVLLARLRPRPRERTEDRTSLIGELHEGWVAVRERSWVWATIAAFSTSLLLAMAPFLVLGPTVARDVYGDDAVFGWASTALGLGTAVGAFSGSWWRPRRPIFAGIVAGVAWPGAFAIYAAGSPLPALYGVMVSAGVGLGLFGVWWETALAQRIPPRLLSRVTAWDWLCSTAPVSVGYLLVGAVAQNLGEVHVLFAGGMLGIAANAMALLPTETRRLTAMSAPP